MAKQVPEAAVRAAARAGKTLATGVQGGAQNVSKANLGQLKASVAKVQQPSTGQVAKRPVPKNAAAVLDKTAKKVPAQEIGRQKAAVATKVAAQPKKQQATSNKTVLAKAIKEHQKQFTHAANVGVRMPAQSQGRGLGRGH